MKYNILIKNTMILIICSVVIRILSLINRIILTRILGSEGIALYTICLPSIMLFLSFGSLSLNIAVTKICSKYNSKEAIIKGIKIGLIASFITSIILLFSLKYIVNYGLKQTEAYYPILFSIPLIFLTSISTVLRGYYTGIKKINITAVANLLEQISRIFISFFFIYLFIDKGLIIAVSISILSMSIGEIISILFTITKLKKYPPLKSNINPSKELLQIAIPTTLTKAVTNISFFLEPIIYTLALSLNNYDNRSIMMNYSEICTYSLPLLTLLTFIPVSIGTSIMPHINSSNITIKIRYIKLSILYSIIPAILIIICVKNYSFQYMKLIYGTTIGANYVKKYAYTFVLYYIQAPLISIMQAIDKSKHLFVISSIIQLIKLLMIFILSYYNPNGLILSITISSTLFTIIIYIIVKKTFKFKFESSTILNLLLLTSITLIFGYILILGNVNYIIATILLIITYLLILYILKITKPEKL